MFTDQQLLSVLDGTADTALTEAVTIALVDDPALEDRMMALDPLAPVVRDSLLPVSGHIEASDFVDEPQQRQPWWPLGLAAAAGGAVMFLTLIFATPDPADDWMVQVAAYQALYSPQTISNVTSTPAELDAQFDRASAAIARDLQVEPLAALEGLSLIRTQVLAFQGEPVAQIVFADQNGGPVAFCITRTGASDTAAVDLRERHGMQSASFARGGYEFLLIGGEDAAQIEQTADVLQQLFS